jgi:hypothetical protein
MREKGTPTKPDLKVSTIHYRQNDQHGIQAVLIVYSPVRYGENLCLGSIVYIL